MTTSRVAYKRAGRSSNFAPRGLWAILALAWVAVLAVGIARASTVSEVTVQEIAIDPAYANVVFIRVSPAPTGQPGCQTDGHWHYVLNFSGSLAAQQYAAILSAEMSGKTVSITGACADYPNVESLRGLNVQG